MIRQGLISNIIGFVSNTNKEQIKENNFYQSFTLPLFMLILIINIIGNITYSFASSSQFITTFSLSFSVFVSSIVIGLLYNGWGFFSLFLPSGVPMVLSPLLVVIEVLSFVSRVISLAVRLSANIISGHILMEMIGLAVSLTITEFLVTIPLFPIPYIILIFLYFMELGIAFLQAYVFALLLLSYFKDSIYLH